MRTKRDYPIKSSLRKTLYAFTVSALVAGGAGAGPVSAANAASGDPVSFADGNLKACVADTLGVSSASTITEGQLADITDLLCSGRQISDITPLQYASSLHTLDLGINEIEDISSLAELSTLEWLDFSSNQVSDVSSLADLTDLLRLSFSGNQVSDVSSLDGLTNLEWLDFSWNQVSDVSPLSGLANLDYLSFSSNQVSDVSPLSGLANLDYLNFFENQVSDVSPLSGLTNLERLDFSWNQVPEVSPLGGLTNLTELVFVGNQVSDVSLLDDLTNLVALYFAGNQVSDVSSLAGLTNLTELVFAGNQVSDVSSLAGLTNLESLSFWDNQVSDVSPLTDLTNLEYLDFSENQVLDVSPLSGLKNLVWLRVEAQQVTLPDLRSGIVFTLPTVVSVDGSLIELAVVEGDGAVNAGEVTWSMPAGGDGALGWEQPITVGGVTWLFSGQMTQQVLPKGETPAPVRLSGSDRFSTAVAVSKSSYPNAATVDTVVLASGYGFADSLSATPLAAKLGAPMLLTGPAALPVSTAAEIARLNPSKVIIIGGSGAVGKAVETQLAVGYTVERYSGADRYETSRMIAKKGWSSVSEVFVASGAGFADGLSAGAAAGMQEAPLILVDGTASQLPAKTNTLLQDLGVTKATVAGGKGAVSAGIEHALKTTVGGSGTVVRGSGTDRFSTAAWFAQRYSTPNGKAYVANGWNFPDALSGAVAAGAVGAPLLLSQPGCLPAPSLNVLFGINPSTVYLLGGTGALSARVATYTKC